MERDSKTSSLGLLALVALPLVCCGVPALVAAGALAATGGWLTAHGLTLGGVLLVAVGPGLAVRWVVGRRRCDVPPERRAAGDER